MPDEFITARLGCKLLHCSFKSWKTIVKLNNVSVFQVPGHSRVLYSKADILRLVAEARQTAGAKGAGA